MQESPILAAIGIPDAKVLLVLAAPFLTIIFLRWLSRRMDEVIHYLFPHAAWESKLGWLNIRALRQADAIMRWVEYVVYAVLVAALYGIVWSAQGIAAMNNWSDPYVMGDLSMWLPILLISAGLWLVYLGVDLIPKLKRDYEENELQKFRLAEAELEQKRQMNPGSRLHPGQVKGRAPLARDSDRLHRPR
ncbi:MAG: hypothetical protein LV479_11820 [Methylacidiphilales bacterium]|nr:hypothetical protein [Candidatus Methylacidiphilales bacterium]